MDFSFLGTICVAVVCLGLCGGTNVVPPRILVTTAEPPLISIPGSSSSPTYNARVAVSILNLLSERLQFRYDVTHPLDYRFGGQVNGTWDGMIGQITRGEADMGASLNAITYARYSAVDFTIPVLFDDTGILIPFPEATSKISATVQPFTLEVWSYLLASVVLIPLVTALRSRLRNAKRGRGGSFTRNLVNLVAILSGQGASDVQSSDLLFGLWALFAVVIGNVYTSVLTSMMTVPRYKPLVNNIGELATSQQIKPVTIQSTAVDALMLGADNGTYKLIGDTFRKHPDTLVQSTSKGLEKVLTGSYAFLEPKLSLQSIIENESSNTTKCRVTLAKETFYPRIFSYMLPKESQLKAPFDQKILLLQQFGFVEYSQRRITLRKDLCSVKNQMVGSKSHRLSLDSLSGAFILLFIGYALAALAFTYESRRIRNKKTTMLVNGSRI